MAAHPLRFGAVAALRMALAAGIVLGLHSVAHFSVWWLLAVGLACALLLASARLPALASLQREDRLALWLVLVCLTAVGYLHNANDWSGDGAGLLRADQLGLWKTEVVLGVALTVPLLHALARLWRRHPALDPGRRFAREFALYINFSGIALALWQGEALLSRSVALTLVAWVGLAELTMYASE